MYKLKKKHLIALVGACLMAGASYTAFAADDNVALPNNNDSAVTHHAPNSVSVGSANINEKEKGAIAIGNGATVSHEDQSEKSFWGVVIRPYAPGNGMGGIAIGEHAFVHTMTAGNHERMIAFNHSADRTQMVGGIAIGDNTHARVGTIDLGNRDYTGEIGDINFGGDSNNVIDGVGTTTIGTNSINSGNFATINGAYNAITNRRTQSGISGVFSNAQRATQGMGATITGTFNSIENNFADDHPYSGLANSIIGVANKVNKSNATIVIGAGNEVSNSYLSAGSTPFDSTTTASKTIKDMADNIRSFAQNNILASVGIFGGANKVTSAAFTNVSGVENVVTGDPNAKNNTLVANPDENYPGYSVFNMVNGYKNTNTLSSHTMIMGSHNNVTKSNHIIGMGNAIIVNSTDAKTANNDVFIGFNAASYVLDAKGDMTPKDDTVKKGENGKWYKASDIANIPYYAGDRFTKPGYYKDQKYHMGEIKPIATADYPQYFKQNPGGTYKDGITNTMVLGNNVMANLDNSVYLGTDSTEAKDGSTAGMLPYSSYDFDPIPVAPVPANPPKLTEAAASSPAPAPLDTASSPSEAPATAANSTPSIFAGATPAGIVSVGSPGKERRIENVAAGYINNNSTDAINGSQLKAVIDHVYTKTKSDERRTQVKGENGITVTSATDDKGANVYTVSLDKDTVASMSKTTTVTAGDNVTVSSKTTGNDTTYTVGVSNDKIKAAVQSELNNKANIDASNIQGDNIDKWKVKLGIDKINPAKTTDITYKANGGDAKTVKLSNGLNFSNGTNTTAEVGDDGVVKYNLNSKLKDVNSIAGTDGKASLTFGDDLTVNNKKVTGVADGDITPTSTDAVNGSQLYNMAHKTTMDIHTLRNETNRGLALSAALAGLHTTSYDPLRKTQFMAALGFHHGDYGVAFGIARNRDENFMYHGSLAFNADDVMANVGITWKWGKKENIDKLPEDYRQGPITSVYVMQKEIEALKAEVKELKEMLKNKK